MKDNLSQLIRVFFFLILILILAQGCQKTIPIDNKPLPPWNNTGADSATLSITVQTPYGFFLSGQFVNLALSNDSLQNLNFVRREPTNGMGTVRFSRLYPGHYSFNCYTSGIDGSAYGSGNTRLLPKQLLDTILIVQ